MVLKLAQRSTWSRQLAEGDEALVPGEVLLAVLITVLGDAKNRKTHAVDFWSMFVKICTIGSMISGGSWTEDLHLGLE